MKQKSKLGKFNIFLTVVLVVVLVANIAVIYTKSIPLVEETSAQAASDDAAVIAAFVSGTYGGVNFASLDDVAKYYSEAYDKTKAQTREYINADGSTEVFYTMLGEEDLQVKNIMIEGKENSIINNLVPGIMGGLYSKGLNGLSPCANRNPELDVDEKGASMTTSRLVGEDLREANVKDNGDGTITLQLQPIAVDMSAKGMDAQGHLFNSLGDIAGVVDQIKPLTWASGTTKENVLVNYSGGYATVTINTSSGLITTADYHMEAHISVNHASIAVLKDKSANLLVTYDVHFPASDKYLMDTKQIKVK